jgi:Golgi apparatus protein 1
VGKEHPCRTDLEKCKDSGGGHDKVMKCLFEKRAELSESCKKHLDDKLKENPCMEGRMKFCGDVKPGEGRIFECMKKNAGDLSAACKEKVEKGKKDDFDKGM